MSAIQQMMIAGQFAKQTYRGFSSDDVNRIAYTFAAQDIGNATADRRVIVGVHGGGLAGDTLSSVTIGGVAATIVVQAQGEDEIAAIAIADVPDGATADVVCTFSDTAARAAIGVWSVVGLTSSTPVDTDSSVSDPASKTLTSVVGGFCIGVASSTDDITVSWTNLTERYDQSLETGGSITSGADSVTTTTSIMVTADFASPFFATSAVFATW